MALSIGQRAPDFQADTTHGRISFHQWLEQSWGILFSHPKDFTPVCTTELGSMARLKPEFDKRGVKIIGLSVDQGFAPNYPMIGDPSLEVAKLYEMLPADAGDSADGRTAADNQAVRTVYVIGPDKKIKLMIAYPMTTGRNFDEILRIVDSLQLTAHHRVATPANWRPGEEVIIAGSVSNDEAAGESRSPTSALCRSPQPSSVHGTLVAVTPPRARTIGAEPCQCEWSSWERASAGLSSARCSRKPWASSWKSP
jgi:alkyl hydroperoxide reductase subunit AhpC